MQNLTLAVSARRVNEEQVTSHKLLVVFFDEKPTFKQHVDNLCNNLSQKIGLLKKLRAYLPKRKLFYDSFKAADDVGQYSMELLLNCRPTEDI